MPRKPGLATDPQEWLRRARSNLARARDDSGVPEVLYEDLCFDAQQGAEKALKAVLVSQSIDFPKVHSISHLIDILEKGKVRVPAQVKDASALTHYAVTNRYPGVSEEVTRKEYLKALGLAEKVLERASGRIGK
jgi:HEPN domain-containing protein